MPAVLNTNQASLYASKNLQSAQSRMADSVERLSSGLRINRAKDDAAGLGISNALTSQINSANQGVRNLNDGISLVQTAEGAISTAQEMAQRILTLAVQGANGTMDANQRSAIKSEMKQLLTAIDSIGTRAKMAGTSLLTRDARTSASTSAADTGTAAFSLQASNTSSDKIDLAVAGFSNIGGQFGVLGSTSTLVDGTTLAMATTGDFNYSSLSVGSNVYKKTSVSGYALVGNVTSFNATTGVMTLTASAAVVVSAGVTLVFSGQMTQQHSSTNTDKSLVEEVWTGADSADNFQKIVRASEGYLTALSKQRSLLGAYQNQIEYTVNNVTDLSANLSAARSNVLDTDYASETASLTKGQILQQAATAMLAQANQMPNVILSLLK
jgi:flagellin